jgi:putative membrane protein
MLLISYLFEGIQVDGIGWAFIAALFLGIFNAVIRPVLFILTLPINLVTLGLFTLVINGLMLWLTGKLLAGFHVQGFWSAVGGALILSLISFAANALVGGQGRVEIIEMRQTRYGDWR